MELSNPYFSGIAGSGMGALAQYLQAKGSSVSGSDRSFDNNQELSKKQYFQNLGIQLFAQDGKGIKKKQSCLVVSTAIEENNPEVQRARSLKLPIYHRAEVLAHLVNQHRCIAVAGTSGKSTVTAMIWHILQAAGLEPSLLNGANLLSLKTQGLLGNAVAGTGTWLVVEADESDGSLVHYFPEIGVILNIEKDHKEIEELLSLFIQFRDQSHECVLGEDSPHAKRLQRNGDPTFGLKSLEGFKLTDIKWGAWEVHFYLNKIPFHLNVPGEYNLANALCAIRTSVLAGASLEQCAEGLSQFKGLERRAIRYSTGRGCFVVDDFAHNPAKISACLQMIKKAQAIETPGTRLFVVFHPHGFTPMRLMGEEILQCVHRLLGPNDAFLLPEVYFAGGSVESKPSGQELMESFNQRELDGEPRGKFFPTKEELKDYVKSIAKSGDWIVSMGARDPNLGPWIKQLAQELI